MFFFSSFFKLLMISLVTIFRHRKENLKKCSLHGLENRSDLCFLTYPTITQYGKEGTILLTPEAPPLSKEDEGIPLILLDATWRLAKKMSEQIIMPSSTLHRSIPPGWTTAYPRRQDEFVDPTKGLASIEALYIAYLILGYDTKGLFDHYHWASLFLEKNHSLLSQLNLCKTS